MTSNLQSSLHINHAGMNRLPGHMNCNVNWMTKFRYIGCWNLLVLVVFIANIIDHLASYYTLLPRENIDFIQKLSPINIEEHTH